uniref:Uncharacterized protein MANES_12G072800 n=1 Tax=Rhizophora mucronata TaxID=61149 RepID=A0A2P2LVX8_RHIMU
MAAETLSADGFCCPCCTAGDFEWWPN